MNFKRLISALVVAGAMLPISSAFAADTKAVKKAEGAMMGACKKSSCYTLHEKWEVVAGNSEASEVHETK